MARQLLSLVLLSFVALAAPQGTTQVTDCDCGVRDPQTNALYTDSLIVYFNETDAIDPNIFVAETFAHKKQHGWNTIYKVGAQAANALIVNDTALNPKTQVLELLLNSTDRNHLVNGGDLQTLRKDIQYGSFQAAFRPAGKWTGGTALSFRMKYNDSQGLDVDFMNMDDPADARISNLVNGEWPSATSITNFTILQAAGLDPWKDFTNFRIDWNETDVNFWIGQNNTRSFTKKDGPLPRAGQSFQLQTWSTGDDTYMEGPPTGNTTKSHVLFVRTFFNSSIMSADDHASFDQRCMGAQSCSTDDMGLRGSTPYSAAALLPWKEAPTGQRIRKNAGIVAGCFSTFGVMALLNTFIRRTPWHKLRPKKKSAERDDSLRKAFRRSFRAGEQRPQTSPPSSMRSESPRGSHTLRSGFSTPGGIQTPLPVYGAQTPRSGTQTPAPPYDMNYPNRSLSLASLHRTISITHTASPITPIEKEAGSLGGLRISDEKDVGGLECISEAPHAEQGLPSPMPSPAIDHLSVEQAEPQYNPHPMVVTDKGKRASISIRPIDAKVENQQEVVTEESLPTVQKPAAKTPTKRIDYVAGLVAVACLGVTLHHWCQTFWPWVTDGYGPGAHYPKVEYWLSIFVGSYALTQLWIGPFFLTATRFLSTNFLKNGNLEDIAKKELRRAPRLFVPIVIISALQYFLLSLNVDAALQWLPSVSWSTWPYVVPQANFGQYVNNIIELAYLYPNAIPEIVSHYCIGVLWTVPVQLQFTYVVLGAAVLIRDIKNPWKRFSFYAVMIITGWYAKSWASCHWCGLVLSDLEATYKWRMYLKTRPVQYYAVVLLAFVGAAGAPLIAVFNQTWSFSTLENSLHPDHSTGGAISDVKSVYPGYNEPTLSIIAFSIGLQILVELSTWIQAFLSTKVILWLHPHIMTIYLTHGFVMWTWGAWVAVTLNQAGVPYWANLLVNLVTTYAMIFLLASILSPLIEIPTQGALRTLDRWTNKEPVPRRDTTAPFSKDLVLNREHDEKDKKEC